MMDSPSIPIVGASPSMARAIRMALNALPGWFVRAARISKVIVENTPKTRDQLAVYEHGVRTLSILPTIGNLLLKAVAHELGHGVDDNFGSPHFFSTSQEWIRIHKSQGHFDIPKYRDEPLEYLSDMIAKLFLLGPQKLRITNSREVTFLTGYVFPMLSKEFS